MQRFFTTLTGIAIGGVALLLSPLAALAATEVVSGDTAAGENQPGWLFNRDLSTQTPFHFTLAEASIGDGSLYIEPITNSLNGNADKFIAEYFSGAAMADITSFSYDYLIGAGGTPADANEFYLNVYANFGTSSPDKFYDCRYNVVPTVGSTTDWTTVTFDPTASYPVTTRGGAAASPFACPASPADMDLLSSSSVVRAFAINVGDTSGSDLGLDGYLDNVIETLVGGETVFDFEPYAVSGEIVAPEADAIVSGEVELLATYDDGDEDNDDAVNWAVRESTCDPGSNVFGNVGGLADPYNWDGASFSATIDTTGLTPGLYCFIFNPTDDEGQADVRETREFYVAGGIVSGGGQIVEEIGKKRKDWYNISFGGSVTDIGELVGSWQMNVHNVAESAYAQSKFHGEEFTELNLFAADSDTCVGAFNFTVLGSWNGDDGYKLVVRGSDSDMPASADPDDTIRFTLYDPGDGLILETSAGAGGDFTDESSCVGSARTGVDAGNLSIADNS